MTTEKSRIFAHISLLLCGYCLCILPPALATLSYFPLFKSSGTVLAGGTLFLLALSIQTLFKGLSRLIGTGATFLPWLILFLLFFALSRVADEMVVISFVGLISNLTGGLTLKLARRVGRLKGEG